MVQMINNGTILNAQRYKKKINNVPSPRQKIMIPLKKQKIWTVMEISTSKKRLTVGEIRPTDCSRKNTRTKGLASRWADR